MDICVNIPYPNNWFSGYNYSNGYLKNVSWYTNHHYQVNFAHWYSFNSMYPLFGPKL